MPGANDAQGPQLSASTAMRVYRTERLDEALWDLHDEGFRLPKGMPATMVDDHRLRVTPSRARLSASTTQQLIDVNRECNSFIRPSLETIRTIEVLRPGQGGECKDYVYTKTALLRKNYGFELWPPGSLLATYCLSHGSRSPFAGHWVLVACTTRGDYVCDNLRKDVHPWDGSKHTLLTRLNCNRTEEVVHPDYDRIMAEQDELLKKHFNKKRRG